MISFAERDHYFKSDDASALKIYSTLCHITWEMETKQCAVPDFWRKEFPAMKAEKKKKMPKKNSKKARK